MPTPTLEQVQQQLAERRAQLQQEVAAKQGPRNAAPREVGDRKDEADARAAGEIDAAEVERDLAELREIAAAQARIADGRYGRCTDCDAEIDAARLLAQPTAVRCLACQSAHEHGSPGHA